MLPFKGAMWDMPHRNHDRGLKGIEALLTTLLTIISADEQILNVVLICIVSDIVLHQL